MPAHHHPQPRAKHLLHDDVIKWKTFPALLAFCAGNSPVPGEFPPQRPVTRNFDVFFDLRLNKRLSKLSWGWWSETPSSSLWRHRNEFESKFTFKDSLVRYTDEPFEYECRGDWLVNRFRPLILVAWCMVPIFASRYPNPMPRRILYRPNVGCASYQHTISKLHIH